ncbi:hypothetical protein RJ640_014745 [Escallonia rubra]|uniref:Uncharacterized protein n=1 Tax=Escallonia rubra TaxID=112253 RepID=A0AA88RST9_9ASTE|nr:hypothetical protein RJ640_014745 [Escallonia rubra]
MDSDSWTRFFSSSRQRHQSRSDPFYGGDELDGEDEARPEFICPFCAEDFDMVGLCCHMDEEHTVEAKNGVCPVCAKRVGMDLVGHITMQHASLLKISFLLVLVVDMLVFLRSPRYSFFSLTRDYVQRKRRYRKGGSNSTFSILKKELREGNLQALLGGTFSSNTEPDPWLSSFILNSPSADEPTRVHPPLAEASAIEKISIQDLPERNIPPSPLSDKDQEEKARKCEFVQGLLLSTFLDEDGL